MQHPLHVYSYFKVTFQMFFLKKVTSNIITIMVPTIKLLSPAATLLYELSV